jgi:membrane-associated phospholipid phosphatase
VGGWFFDRGMRNALRADTDAGRSAADTTSTVLEGSLIAAPLGLTVGESLALHAPLLDATWMLAVDAEAFAVSGLVSFALKSLFGRERPFATEAHLSAWCLDDEHRDDPRCRGDRNASFLSGHTSTAFTGAGLVCAQRAYFGAGQPTWDAVACGAAIAGATTTALLRITADRHYATDTLAGAVLGLGAGFVLPIALHYSDSAPLAVGRSMARNDGSQDPGAVLIGMGAGLVVGAAIPLGIALVRHLTHHAEQARAHRYGHAM